ncbi:hypothetical protein GCM10023321_82530 [Pseudonocardia eucalypti]|uniref:Right handed beta helix domain-containing protein n=1 Tax=Pseudonocardia eucalypti TaxID=648755 RepID=A0ABP9RDR1_9PSEU|nr:hypothetical protein [Pseudonocardia eucalypti]
MITKGIRAPGLWPRVGAVLGVAGGALVLSAALMPTGQDTAEGVDRGYLPAAMGTEIPTLTVPPKPTPPPKPEPPTVAPGVGVVSSPEPSASEEPEDPEEQEDSPEQVDPTVPTAEPTVPPVPSLPQTPSLPQVPSLPGGLPQAPSLPGGLPQVPSLPGGLPQAPSLPGGLPQVPSLPGGLPQAPSLPGGLPQVPAGLPQAPALPGLPNAASGETSAPGDSGDVPRTLPPVTPAPPIPGAPSLPGGLPAPQLPGGLPAPQLPGGLPQVPGGLPQVPQLPGGLPAPQLPGGLPQLPAGLPQAPALPGGLPQVPGGLPQVPGGLPPAPALPGGLPQVPAASPVSGECSASWGVVGALASALAAPLAPAGVDICGPGALRPAPVFANCTKQVDGAGLQAAVDAAVPGDRICARDGGPADRLKITRSGTASAPIMVIGDGNGTVKGISVSADHVIVQGFNSVDAAAPAIEMTGTGSALLNNTVRGPKGGDGDGIRFFGKDLLISHNTVSDVKNSGGAHADCMQTFATNTPGSSNVLIHSNRCEKIDNQCLIAEGPNSGAGDGSGKGESAHITFTNNFCDSHASQAVWIDDVKNVVLTNNVITGSNTKAFGLDNKSTGALIGGNRISEGIGFEVGMDHTSREGYQGPEVGGEP